ACAARSIADTSENAPVYRAMGVLAPATITTSVGNILDLPVLRAEQPQSIVFRFLCFAIQNWNVAGNRERSQILQDYQGDALGCWGLECNFSTSKSSAFPTPRSYLRLPCVLLLPKIPPG